MKTVTKKSFLLVIAMALVLSISVGLTLAYFSDNSEAKGGAALTLGGSIKIVEPVVTDTGKQIQIVNTGETDVLVRVRVIGPSGTETKPQVAADWVYDGKTDYWYYTKVLPVGGTASDLNATFSGSKIAVAQFDVLVVSDCVQVAYDTDNKIVKPADWYQDFIS